MQRQERRRVQRVRLLEPLRGLVANERVFIADVSINGFRIVSQTTLGPPGTAVRVQFEWDGRRVSADARIIHIRQTLVGEGQRARQLFHSGMEITQVTETSRNTLRELVAWHVAKALDEQKANARGIPAVAAQSFQTGKTNQLVRHELVAGRWREIPTNDGKQPLNGFTISAELSDSEVMMLRSSFEAGDADARKLIRQMAELSVSKSEGIPTRKYTP
ncbi:MAG TPA: PilZ domain-containing protein [Thermoanaerobaculia bacterium]|nr:PilZ domain-containing protein [Thermoanaerobaculia bacterium]